jgi:hypothetical protein
LSWYRGQGQWPRRDPGELVLERCPTLGCGGRYNPRKRHVVCHGCWRRVPGPLQRRLMAAFREMRREGTRAAHAELASAKLRVLEALGAAP